jgi:hypothetical protein
MKPLRTRSSLSTAGFDYALSTRTKRHLLTGRQNSTGIFQVATNPFASAGSAIGKQAES